MGRQVGPHAPWGMTAHRTPIIHGARLWRCPTSPMTTPQLTRDGVSVSPSWSMNTPHLAAFRPNLAQMTCRTTEWLPHARATNISRRIPWLIAPPMPDHSVESALPITHENVARG